MSFRLNSLVKSTKGKSKRPPTSHKTRNYNTRPSSIKKGGTHSSSFGSLIKKKKTKSKKLKFNDSVVQNRTFETSQDDDI